MEIREIQYSDKITINQVVEIHLATFQGFFLTFMGRGFLKQMYSSYCNHAESKLLVAFDGDKIIGFLAYSYNLSALYKLMIKKSLIPFAWYSMGAFFRRPKIFMRLIRAFLKPNETKRDEKYVELASIGVDPKSFTKGTGTQLISELKRRVDFSQYKYITLETDAVSNDSVNEFYLKNEFKLVRKFQTHEGRVMNEYRYSEELL